MSAACLKSSTAAPPPGASMTTRRVSILWIPLRCTAHVIISESGLHSLILTSRKPAAKRFRKWVTGEVIPSIRQTGGYGTASVAAALSDPATLRQLLIENTGRVLELQAENAVLSPKAIALDRFTAGAVDGSLCLTDAAKVLKVPRKELISFMAHDWIYRRSGTDRWVGYHAKVAAGLVEHRVTTITRTGGAERLIEQVLITPKGIARLAERLTATTR